MLRKTSLFAAVVMAASSAVSSHAAVLLNETFTYVDGSLPIVSSGAWVGHSGTSAGTQSVVNNALLIADNDATVPAGGAQTNRDYNRGFSSAVTSGTVYAAFDLTVLSSDRPSSTSGKYFAHFGSRTASTPTDGTALSNFASRITLQSITGNTTNFNIGIGGGTTTTYSPSSLSLDTTYRVVVAYELATGLNSLFINPTSTAAVALATNTGSVYANIDSFAFRVDDGSDGDKTVDNLLIADDFASVVVPEPSALALLGLGGLALARRRRA